MGCLSVQCQDGSLETRVLSSSTVHTVVDISLGFTFTRQAQKRSVRTVSQALRLTATGFVWIR